MTLLNLQSLFRQSTAMDYSIQILIRVHIKQWQIHFLNAFQETGMNWLLVQLGNTTSVKMLRPI